MLTSLPQYSHLHCVWILIMLLKDGIVRHCELLMKKRMMMMMMTAMMIMMTMMIKDEDDDEENGLALTPLSWQCAMMKAEYHWVVPCKAYSSSYILASIFLISFIALVMIKSILVITYFPRNFHQAHHYDHPRNFLIPIFTVLVIFIKLTSTL